jgi:hypothetical protein
MYDYKITSTLSNGATKSIGYQAFIKLLNMQDEIMHGAKLSAGGLPQVIDFCDIVKKMTTGCKKLTIQYNGETVAVV